MKILKLTTLALAMTIALSGCLAKDLFRIDFSDKAAFDIALKELITEFEVSDADIAKMTDKIDKLRDKYENLVVDKNQLKQSFRTLLVLAD